MSFIQYFSGRKVEHHLLSAVFACRNYAIRRVNDAFRENRRLADGEELKNKIAEGYKSLETIKRQVRLWGVIKGLKALTCRCFQALISHMYQADKLIIENIRK